MELLASPLIITTPLDEARQTKYTPGKKNRYGEEKVSLSDFSGLSPGLLQSCHDVTVSIARLPSLSLVHDPSRAPHGNYMNVVFFLRDDRAVVRGGGGGA